MICVFSRLAARSNTLTGLASELMFQWYTERAVTIPSEASENHFQNTIDSPNWIALSFCLVARLNTCRLSPFTPSTFALSAMICSAGFMMADSAVIGRRCGADGLDRSTMSSWLVGDVSRTHTYLSDSSVTLANVMALDATPSAPDVSCGVGTSACAGR